MGHPFSVSQLSQMNLPRITIIADPAEVYHRGHARYQTYSTALPTLQAWVSAEEKAQVILADILAEVIAVIDCTTCARCCDGFSPEVTVADQARLAAGLLQTVAQVRDAYLKPMWPDADEDQQVWLLPAPCPFLKERKCGVYAHRPMICRAFPQDLGETLTQRLAHFVESARFCPITYNVLENLLDRMSHDHRPDNT